MTNNWKIVGTTAPLFDRLVDLEPDVSVESVPFTNYDREQTINSIMKEAEALLNTRCKISWQEYQKLNPAQLEYGVPELYGFPDQSYGDPSNSDGAAKLARLMANSLKLFEPRLENVSIEIGHYDSQNQTLALNIQAHLKIGDVLELISFPVSIQNFKDIGRKEKKAYQHV